MAKKLDLSVVKELSSAQLRELLAEKEAEELQPAINRYYALKKEYKEELEAAHKEILAIKADWEPKKPSNVILDILNAEGTPMTQAELQEAIGEEFNVGLVRSQLVKKGAIIEKDGKYSLPANK